ncbi:MAG: hypothetical protein AAF368_04475 [Planctomycetota bacterium]
MNDRYPSRVLLDGEPRPIIGDYSLREKLAYLERIGDLDGVANIRSRIEGADDDTGAAAQPLGLFGRRKTRAYEYTEHAFGYIAPGTAANGPIQILDARTISADPGLLGTSLKVTLDRLRVFEYPGSGEHSVLVEFSGLHQTDQATDEKERLKFAQTYRVQEGQGAGIAGFPVFIGLRSPKDGIQFEIRTINVRNKSDEQLLSAFESDEVQAGLELIPMANPVVGMLSGVATGLVGAILKRNRNVAVQDIFLGLDFSAIATRPKLREGTYVAVQIPDSKTATWDWSDWQYEPTRGRVVAKDSDPPQLIHLNYVTFSISKRV